MKGFFPVLYYCPFQNSFGFQRKSIETSFPWINEMESSEDDVISLYPLDFSSDEERFAFNDVKETYEETLIANEGPFEGDRTHVVPVSTARQKKTRKSDGKKAVSGVFLATLSDEELEKMSIQDFNKHLRGLPADFIRKLRKKRRVLKNRKYSKTFRQRGSEKKNNIDAENRALEFAIFQAKEQLRKVVKERDEFKQKYTALKRTVTNLR